MDPAEKNAILFYCGITKQALMEDGWQCQRVPLSRCIEPFRRRPGILRPPSTPDSEHMRYRFFLCS
jgi:hypothetical protein